MADEKLEQLRQLQIAVWIGDYETVEKLIQDNVDVNGRFFHLPLCLAAWKGHAAILLLLISAGANVDKNDCECDPSIMGEEAKLVHNTYVNEVKKITFGLDYIGDTPLITAALSGNTECVDILLKAGACVNKNGLNGWTALMAASSRGFLSCVQKLLAAGADVNSTCNGWSPLLRASKCGHKKCVQALINKGANVNQRDTCRKTSIMYASIYGEEECLKYLVVAGGDVNLKDHQGVTAAMFATLNDNNSCLEILLNAGVDVNASDIDGNTPLILGVTQGRTNCVQMLLDAGADIDFQNKGENSPLIIAARMNNEDNLKLLLQYDPDVNKVNYEDETALMMTAIHGNLTYLNLLIKKGANLNHQNCYGTTALKVAVQHNNYNCLESLLRAGADMDVFDVEGRTPLMIAIEERNIEIFNLLLEKGADVNIAKLNINDTPLMVASSNGDDYMTEKLIKAGARLNEDDYFGDTALMYAVNSPSIVKCLLNSGADVNRCLYKSPLITAAAESNQKTCIQYMISAGADVNFVDQHQKTAFSVALTNAKVEFVKILLSAGAHVNMGIFHSDFFLDNLQQLQNTKEQSEIVEILFASGQELQFENKKEVERFSPLVREATLKNICRKAIRKHLISVDKYSHLYNRIPRIKLPYMLTDYLLYNTSLKP